MIFYRIILVSFFFVWWWYRTALFCSATFMFLPLLFVLSIHSVHIHWGNTFQRQNYKMRLKQRSLNWINSMQVKKILFTNVFFSWSLCLLNMFPSMDTTCICINKCYYPEFLKFVGPIVSRGQKIMRSANNVGDAGPHVRQTFLNDVFTFLTEVGNAKQNSE
jgi:hypothetical protein